MERTREENQPRREGALNPLSVTLSQFVDSLLAVGAFIPVTVCPGYIAAWFLNLHGFRQRSLIEQIFWSVPLSMAVSTIVSVLVGKFISLTAVVVFLILCVAVCVGIFIGEWIRRRGSGAGWLIGWRPCGRTGLIIAALWIAFVVLSLVDIEGHHRLFLNVALLDQSYRVDWTEAVLHTGVPPANPLYLYVHPASMRNYYFWYVLCAAVAKMTHLPVRPVFTASCVWAGFALAALIGLYLKHFLLAGDRLRRQFLLAIGLLVVTGLDIGVVAWNFVYFHIQPPADLEAWSRDGIPSWLHTLFWAPHHAVSMVCCMLAFLLAWMAKKNIVPSIVLIALALASAFGLSIYVTFAFFLVMLVWAAWQMAFERVFRPALVLAGGGVGAILLLLPYLRELTHTDSAGGGNGGSLFSLAIRQMIPPDGLVASHLLQPLAAVHPEAAQNLAKLILLAPGYALELGFYLAVLFVYLVPAWRGRSPLTPAQRSLVFIGIASLPFMSFIRSGVLQTNDFAWRSALFLQFPLLLLGSGLMLSWRLADQKSSAPSDFTNLPRATPQWLRSMASFALVIGIFSTICQALMFRFLLPLGDLHSRTDADPDPRSMSQKAYVFSVGYAQLDAAIADNAVVQFNPENPARDRFAMIVNMLGIDHQAAITSDTGGCGSEIGGDPSGCPIMTRAIDPLFHGGSAAQARAVCSQFGIQYLVVSKYDPAWNDSQGWVWTLKPAVSDPAFRALECGK